MSSTGLWRNCDRCGGRYKVTDGRIAVYCYDCVNFSISLDPMDWRLFQIQRSTLIALTNDDRLSEAEAEHLTGILHLTDSIVDEAVIRGYPVPSLDEVVLDRFADV